MKGKCTSQPQNHLKFMEEQIQKEKSSENNRLSFKTEFEKDVYEGLRSSPKHLKSKYFYDSTGDKLFQKIMELPEYYLTNCELEILQRHKTYFFEIFKPLAPFQLVDLGAGDAFKSKVLLYFFAYQRLDFTYVPVDISPNAVRQVTENLKAEISGLRVKGISDEYQSALNALPEGQDKVILFLGSSIGNMTREDTQSFLQNIASKMDQNDHLIIGFDLKKDPETILAAYNDKQGITAQFNLNLLRRINRELKADFDLDSFEHFPSYNEEEGEARSALVSLKTQEINIPKLNIVIHLEKGEKIHTEISRKFDFEDIQDFAMASGFEVLENLTDSRKFFTNSIWKKRINN